MKHKTSELTGELLDAAVAKAEGHTLTTYACVRGTCWATKAPNLAIGNSLLDYSSDWEDGIQIIERELIALLPFAYENGPATVTGWEAAVDVWGVISGHASGPEPKRSFGKTPLIAAMRAYVAHKLGAEVELP